MGLRGSLVFLVAALVMTSVIAPAEAESLSKGWNRINRQAKTNIDNAGKKAKNAIDKAGKQAETNLKHAGSHVARDVKNFFRWVREDNCDRVKRKDGPKAEKECRDEQAKSNAAHRSSTPTGYADQYYAAIEVDCWKPGQNLRWGTTTVQIWSKVSKRDAGETAWGLVRAGDVCKENWNDQNLTDGEARWVSQ